MRAVLLALLLLGCGEVHFVDPNPPRLFWTAASYTSAAVDEPIVWIAILDLFFEDDLHGRHRSSAPGGISCSPPSGRGPRRCARAFRATPQSCGCRCACTSRGREQ